MDIHIKPELESWLRAEVERGAFPSIDSAVEHTVALARSQEAAVRALDLSWTRVLIEQAEASIAGGKGVVAEEAVERIEEHLKTLG